MGFRAIEADGEQYEFDEDATIAEVKGTVGASADDVATYVDDDGGMVALSDRDRVAHLPEGTQVAFQPKDTYFGAEAGR